jgi:hypothetical protein
MAYSITRGAKIKDRAKLTNMARHNFRLRTQSNIDAAKTPKNRIIVNKLGVDHRNADDLNTKLTAYYNGLGVKEKKGNVLMMEFIATASPEFFVGKSEEEINTWVKAQVDFFEGEFGNNLKLAIVHMDETSPHLHFAVSCEEKRQRRFKNRHGEGVKESYALNARRWDPAFFIGLQDRYAAHNSVFGLERGKRGSKAEHRDLMEEVEALRLRNKSQRELIKSIKAALRETKKSFSDLIDDTIKLIDIVAGKDLTDNEAAEIARVVNKVRPARAPKAK